MYDTKVEASPEKPLSHLDTWGGYLRNLPPTTLFYIVAGLVSALLLACVAFIWSLGRCGAHAKQADACRSFLLNVEVGNIDDWVVPAGCGPYVESYTEFGQYQADFAAAVGSVCSYINSLGAPAKDGRDMWILDIDETSLSNVPFFEKYTSWGTEAWTDRVQEVWDAWVMEGTAKALLPTLELYKEMRSSGWQIAFITGRSEEQRNVTADNLRAAGFEGWQSLTCRLPKEMDELALSYKSRHRQDLVSQGFRIRGGMGDQWSDLRGPESGARTFKVPNPMYFVG